MNIDSKDFRVKPGTAVHLSKWETRGKHYKYWKQYVKAYEECLSATSTHHAPWYLIPADNKENARLIVSQIVLDTLTDLKMEYPKTTPQHERELQTIRKHLMK